MADNRAFYNEILLDHNMHPGHKHELPNADMEMRGYNPTCGDDITLRLKVADGVVVDGAFTGSGCAISQASADMMLDLVIGKPKDEALRISWWHGSENWYCYWRCTAGSCYCCW